MFLLWYKPFFFFFFFFFFFLESQAALLITGIEGNICDECAEQAHLMVSDAM